MIEYAPYTPADGREAVEVWNLAIGQDFPMDHRLWRQNVDESAYTDFRSSVVARDPEARNRLVGFMIVKSPRNINSMAVAPDRQRQGIGTAMADAALKASASDPDAKWTFGQDRGHFFPGVPRRCDSALAFFENKLGFTRGTGFAVDLVRDLADYEIEPRIRERIESLARDGIVLAPCTVDDQAALVDHIAASFSGRWLDDTIHRIEVEPTPREIIIAKRPSTGQVVGFAQTFSNKSQYVGPSIYWRPRLGPKYGGLGPIGVDKDVRKIGLGLALLAYSVQSVKERGMSRMAIDWTDLVEFYAKIGFTPWNQYISMWER